MGIPTVTTACEPILFRVPGPAILKEGANAILLAVGTIKCSEIQVAWKEGTARYPQDGGFIQLCDCRKIVMTFKNDLWHLPVFAPATQSVCVHSQTTTRVSYAAEQQMATFDRWLDHKLEQQHFIRVTDPVLAFLPAAVNPFAPYYNAGTAPTSDKT
eukprot:789501-Rhodomonas_salina.2